MSKTLDSGSTKTVTDKPEPGKLRGSMGTFSLVALTIACISPLTATAGYLEFPVAYGDGLGAPMMNLIVGVVLLIFAVGFMAMFKDVGRPGGLYAYITSGLGKRIGLGGGFLAMITYLVAEVSLAIFGGISLSSAISGSFNGPTIPWYWFTFAYIVLAAVASYFNIAVSAKLLGVMLAIELLFVLGFNAAVFLQAGSDHYVGAADSFSLSTAFSGSVPVAFLFIIWLYTGFESPSLYFEETKNPRRSVPRATYLIIAIIAVLYSLTTFAFIVGYGPDQAVAAMTADSVGGFQELFSRYLGNGMFQVCTLFIQTGVFASLLSGNNILARYLYNFGTDGVLPSFLGRANRRTGAPGNASITVAILIAIITFAGVLIGGSPDNLEALMSAIGTYGFLIMFGLVSIAVLVYFARTTGLSTRRRIIYASTSLISTAVFAFIIIYISGNLDLLTTDEAFAVTLAIVVWASLAIGILYAVFLSARRPATFAKIGREEFSEFDKPILGERL